MIDPLRWEQGKIVLIDQRKLPFKQEYICCATVDDLKEAIATLAVRGAPLLGLAGAYGIALAAHTYRKADGDLLAYLNRCAVELERTRPTAVNLSWGINRQRTIMQQHEVDSSLPERIYDAFIEQAHAIKQQDLDRSAAIAHYGIELVGTDDGILTYCNAGALATAGGGTALSILFEAQRRNIPITVYACETRPLLQGARLTCWELMQYGIPVTLLCDNAVGALMAQARIHKIFVGADRIARNGDSANKIGTMNIAVIAKRFQVPFYIVAPTNTIDFELATGQQIPIEHRDADEVRCFRSERVAPDVAVYNPAFDVTPSDLITGIVTDKGVLKPPFKKSISRLFEYEQTASSR